MDKSKINGRGYDILERFYRKAQSLTSSEKQAIVSNAKIAGGTFAGAAWAHFKNSRYSPHREQPAATKRGDAETRYGYASTSKPTSKSKPKKPPQKSPVRQKTKPVAKPKSPPKPKSPRQKLPYVKELKAGIRTIVLK